MNLADFTPVLEEHYPGMGLHLTEKYAHGQWHAVLDADDRVKAWVRGVADSPTPEHVLEVTFDAIDAAIARSRIDQCIPCRDAYREFQVNGRCRVLRRGDIAHLTHSTWRNGDAMCEIPKDTP